MVRARKTRRHVQKPPLHLPQEIISDILCRLPVKSLLRFKSVSKPWRALINDSFFINQHLNRSKNRLNTALQFYGSFSSMILASCGGLPLFDYCISMDDLNTFCHKKGCYRTTGSCNGLLCVKFYGVVQDAQVQLLWLYNLSTRQYKLLPPLIDTDTVIPKPHRCVCMQHGIGYNATSSDYQVLQVQILRGIDDDRDFTEVQVYSLSKNTWRRIKVVPQNFDWLRTAEGKFVNGAIHWVGFNRTRRLHEIIAYDFATENFYKVPLPPLPPGYRSIKIQVVGLSGCLGLIREYAFYVEGWMMKDYGIEQSWTKFFETRHDAIELYAGCIVNEASDIFVTEDDYILLCDAESKGVKRLRLKPRLSTHLAFATSYTESLIALH